MSFDIEPDGDPHGECALEIKNLTEEKEKLTRFGEWLGVDMSNCYDAEDCVRLWQSKVMELVEAIQCGIHHMPAGADPFDTFKNTAKEAIGKLDSRREY